MTIMYPLLPFYAEHHGAGPLGAGLLDFGLRALSTFRWTAARPSLRPHGPKAAAAFQPGRDAVRLHPAGVRELPLVDFSVAHHRWAYGGKHLACAGLHRGCDETGRADQVVCGDRDRIRCRFSDRARDLRLPRAVQLSISGVCSDGVIGNEHPGDGSASSRNAKPSVEGAAERRLSVLAWGSYAKYFRQPNLSGLLWQFFAFMFCFSLFMSGFPLFAERRYTWEGMRSVRRRSGTYTRTSASRVSFCKAG